jgi:hypothetical protein
MQGDGSFAQSTAVSAASLITAAASTNMLHQGILPHLIDSITMSHVEELKSVTPQLQLLEDDYAVTAAALEVPNSSAHYCTWCCCKQRSRT